MGPRTPDGENISLSALLDRFTEVDELLAQLINQQEQQAQLLEQIRDAAAAQPEPPDVNIDQLDVGQSAVSQGVRDAEIGRLVPIPGYSGARALFPAAGADDPISINLAEGRTRVPGIGTFEGNFNTLERLGADNALSGLAFSDTGVTMTARNADGERTGTFNTQQAEFAFIQALEVAEIEISSPIPFAFALVFSTALRQQIKIMPFGIQTTRFGHQATTQDALTPVDFIPFTTVADVLNDYQVPDLDTAVASFGSSTLVTSSAAYNSFIIDNEGANDVEWQLVGFDVPNEATIADPDVHTTTDPTTTETLAPGDPPEFVETATQLSQRRLNVRNATAGNDSEVSVQYFGQAPGMVR